MSGKDAADYAGIFDDKKDEIAKAGQAQNAATAAGADFNEYKANLITILTNTPDLMDTGTVGTETIKNEYIKLLKVITPRDETSGGLDLSASANETIKTNIQKILDNVVDITDDTERENVITNLTTIFGVAKDDDERKVLIELLKDIGTDKQLKAAVKNDSAYIKTALEKATNSADYEQIFKDFKSLYKTGSDTPIVSDDVKKYIYDNAGTNWDDRKNTREVIVKYTQAVEEDLINGIIANTDIINGDSSKIAYAKILYSVIKNCNSQKEVEKVIGNTKLTEEQFEELASVVSKDKKPSKLALQILTTPEEGIIESRIVNRKKTISTLINGSSEIQPCIQYLLIQSLQNKKEYEDEKLREIIKTKMMGIAASIKDLPQAGSIFSSYNTDNLYISIINKRLDINKEIGISESVTQSKAYALKLDYLCNNDRNTIIKTYKKFLDRADKSSIGDDESSKKAILNVIVSACQEDTKLFTKIITGNVFTEENKIDLIKRKYSLERCDSEVREQGIIKKDTYIYINEEKTAESIIQDCEQILQETKGPEGTIENESIFVKGVNEALKYRSPIKVAGICKYINGQIETNSETLESLKIKGRLLSEISARQTEQFNLITDTNLHDFLDSAKEKRLKPILDDENNDKIISKLIDIDKKVYKDNAEKDSYIPLIYHFIETIQNSNIKEKQSKKVADGIISKLKDTSVDFEAGEVLNILSGCKTADKEKEKPTYNTIIDGLASQANDNNIDCIKNIISSCLESKDEKEQNIAVDLYHKISQKQSNNLQKNNFSESNLSRLLLETPLQAYIEQNKKGEYEIITGGLLVKKQDRSVEKILKDLNLSEEQIRVYKEQIALLSTPEEVFDLLNGLIKNHNTKIASGMDSGYMDLLASSDRDAINVKSKKHDLKGLFIGKSSKEKERNREKLYEELEEKASQAGFKEKEEIRRLIKKLKRKEKEFARAREGLTNFADLHIKRAREAAEYIAKYNKLNKIINDKNCTEKDREEARRERKVLAKGNYDFMNHAHGWGRAWRKKKNPIQFIWSMFTYKSKRKLYYAKKELEKSNKALRVVIGVDFVPEYDSKKGTKYTIRTNVIPNPDETTIKSKKLRMIKQHEDAGFLSRLWGGGKARYSRFRELNIHRKGDATAMEGFAEKFIKETSDLRKEAVEILVRKNYYSKSSLREVKTSDKEDPNFIYDAAFGTSKDQENGDKGKGRS